MAAVYWIGQDGNIYVKGGGAGMSGVVNAGKAISYNDKGYSGASRSGMGTRIADPNAPRQAGATAPSGGTGGGTGGDGGAAADAARRAANAASRTNTQKAIDSLDTELNVGFGNIDNEAGSIRTKYDKEAARNEEDYTGKTTTNTQNLLKNKQNALLAAAQGRRGLRGTLASLGALGGDGAKLADRAVTTAANSDLGEAADTFGTNAQTLDKAIGRFREEDQDRRSELETSRKNQRTALEGRVESKKQNLFQKMAELFGSDGDAGNATNWLNRAGDLNQSIAQKTAVAAPAFAARVAAFTPGELAEYLAGAGDMTVRAEDGSGGINTPSSILAGRKKEEKRATA